MKILDFYRGYMLELCRLELYDDVGNKYICYDEDLYQALQYKLIKELRDHFELRQPYNLSIFHRGREFALRERRVNSQICQLVP